MTFTRLPRQGEHRSNRRSFAPEGWDTVAHGENTCVERCGSPVNLDGRLGPRCVEFGSQEFIQEVCEERLQQERDLWEAIPWVPDFQCAWQVLLQCAGPRCHHLVPSNTDGRTGAQGGNKNGPGSFLGLLGWCASHDRQAPPSVVANCGSRVVRSCSSWMFGGSGQCFRRFGPKVVSSHDQHGKSCAQARDLLFLLSAPNQVSGNMAGSTTRLLLPNSTFGRRWYLPSRALLTRLTCDLILAQFRARCYTEFQQDQSSNWHRISSGRLCWRACDCFSKCPRPIVNAGRL